MNAAVLKKQQGSTGSSLIPLKDLRFQDTFTKELTPDPQTPHGPARYKGDRGDAISSSSSSAAAAVAGSFHNPFATSGSVSDLSCPFPDSVVRTSRLVRHSAYTFLHPEPISRPLLLHHSADTLALLELEPLIIPSSSSPSSSTASNNNNTKLIQQAEEKLAYFLNIFSAHKEIPDSKPWCSVYGGHQYGFYAGQLGDGRVVSLGEIVVPSSPTSQSSNRWEVTLKGCGRTPYSRFGDGYCSLTACIREYLGSEFLAALGIPTTRCISVIASDRYIVRDKMEPSGCIARASPSWLRFGHFELLWYRAEKVELRELADYAIKYHFGGHLQQGNDQSTNTTTTITMTIYPVPMTDAPPPHERATQAAKNKQLLKMIKPDRSVDVKIPLNKYAKLFAEITRRSAVMIANWQAAGFVHGVMNTDNMSILGLTMDYGPFGFLESYDPQWTSNESDVDSRYSFDQQPKIGAWNLIKLGRCFVELVMLPITTAEESGGAGAGAGTTASFTPIVGQLPQGYSVQGHDLVKELLRINYEPVFIETFTDLMRKKLGLRRGGVATDLQNLILPLLQLLADTGVDYTVFFRALCDFRVAEVDFRLHAHGEVKPPAIGDKKIKSRPMCSKTCRSLLIEGITARIAEEQAEEKRKAEDEAKKSERGGGVSRKHSMANVQASLAGLMPTNTVSESLSRRPSHRLSVVVVEDDKQDAVVVVEGDKRGKNKGEQDIRQRLTEGGDKINNNNDSIPSPLSTSEEEVFLPLPTVDEVKSRWAEWATKYRDRLVEENHVYPQPSTVEQIDSLRSEAMRKANPRYVLRNWILDDLSDRLIQQGIHTIYPPPFFHNGGVTDGVGGGMVAGTDGDNSSSSDAVKEALDRMRIEIDRVVHVLIADVYGDVADSLKGWSAVEKMASESWYEEIVDGEVGNINAKSSCL